MPQVPAGSIVNAVVEYIYISDLSIHQRLQMVRAARGLAGTTVTEALGWTPNALERFEFGGDLAVSEVLRLMALYGVRSFGDLEHFPAVEPDDSEPVGTWAVAKISPGAPVATRELPNCGTIPREIELSPDDSRGSAHDRWREILCIGPSARALFTEATVSSRSARDASPPQRSDLARQVQALRRLRRMTQADLSRLTGVAMSDISRFEGGRSAATTRTIDKIVKALGARIVLVPNDGSEDADSVEPSHGPASPRCTRPTDN